MLSTDGFKSVYAVTSQHRCDIGTPAVLYEAAVMHIISHVLAVPVVVYSLVMNCCNRMYTEYQSFTSCLLKPHFNEQACWFLSVHVNNSILYYVTFYRKHKL